MENVQFKRRSSQSVVMFNGNRAMNEFKDSIPELKMSKKKSKRKAYGADSGIQEIESGDNESPRIGDF